MLAEPILMEIRREVALELREDSEELNEEDRTVRTDTQDQSQMQTDQSMNQLQVDVETPETFAKTENEGEWNENDEAYQHAKHEVPIAEAEFKDHPPAERPKIPKLRETEAIRRSIAVVNRYLKTDKLCGVKRKNMWENILCSCSRDQTDWTRSHIH